MTAWAWLAIALLATAVGQIVFKLAADRRSRGLSIAAAATFCLAPPASFFALRGLSLGTVYVSTAITQVLVVVAAMWCFGERYTRLQWTGLSLILAGVVLFNLKSIS